MRRFIKRPITLAGLLIVVATLSLPMTVFAKNGITVSPPLKEITLGPGLLETSSDISIENNTAAPVVASLKLVDLKDLGEFGGSNLSQAGLPEKYKLANWLSLPEGDNVKIGSNESVKVKVKITNRQDLSPGGHYGAIIITTSADGSKNENVSLSQQLASLLFVKKTGGEHYGMELTSLTPNSSVRIPDSIALNFKNTGNTHVVPRGFVEVTDPKNRLVAKAIINPDSVFILPEQSRSLTALFKPVANSGGISGRYTITAYYRYDGQEQFSTKSVYFNQSSIWGRVKYPLIITLIAIVALLAHKFVQKTRQSAKRSKK